MILSSLSYFILSKFILCTLFHTWTLGFILPAKSMPQMPHPTWSNKLSYLPEVAPLIGMSRDCLRAACHLPCVMRCGIICGVLCVTRQRDGQGAIAGHTYLALCHPTCLPNCHHLCQHCLGTGMGHLSNSTDNLRHMGAACLSPVMAVHLVWIRTHPASTPPWSSRSDIASSEGSGWGLASMDWRQVHAR